MSEQVLDQSTALLEQFANREYEHGWSVDLEVDQFPPGLNEDVVRALPSAYRELIILRHGHDLSYDEIAEVTGLPLGTVKNRIFRAREAMRLPLVARGITRI